MKFGTDFSFTAASSRAQHATSAPPPVDSPPLDPPPPAPWTPASLFASGVQGAWYDPSDIATLFQDTAATAPVTATGQAVAVMQDKSGLGRHLTQPTLAKRPTYQTDGTLHWLNFDGVDDFLSVASFDLSATDKVTIFAGIYTASDASGLYLELSTNANSFTGTFWAGRVAASTFSAFARGTAGVSANQLARSAAAFAPPSKNVVTNSHDIAGNLSQVRVDGANGGVAGTGNKGTGNFSNRSLFLGMRGGASLPFQGRVYGLVLHGTLSTAAEISYAETYLAMKAGTAP